MTLFEVLLQRFEEKYIPEPNSGCWLWIGAYSGQRGYGTMWNGERLQLAHRLSYELHKSGIPKDYDIDHKCSTPICVNPNHLDAVTRIENLKRTNERGRASSGNRHAHKTHCPQGHPYSGDNLYIRVRVKKKARICRECCKNAQRLRRLRKAII